MTRSLPRMFILLAFMPNVVFCQTDASSSPQGPQLYRVDAKSPAGLRRLFRYDGHAMPLVSAHRGGAEPGFPENCLATYEHTLRHTLSMMEIDLRFSKDGKIVIHHDPTLERTTNGVGLVADRTLAELKKLRLKDPEGKITEYQIPTLDETLEWARGKTILVLDKKDVPVKACVQKIEEQRAESYAMLMAYSFKDVRECYDLNRDIMLEVMLGNRERFQQFEETGVPWSNVFVFVGHAPPYDEELLKMIHAQGASCMAGTSRNLDRQIRAGQAEGPASLRQDYLALLQQGIDLIETDRPIQVGNLLYPQPAIPGSKSDYFHTR